MEAGGEEKNKQPTTEAQSWKSILTGNEVWFQEEVACELELNGGKTYLSLWKEALSG